MRSETFYQDADDGCTNFVYQWIPKMESPRRVVQIAHGMAEHAGRYHDFARALVGSGYAVFANDHRGHGKTAGSPEHVGFFAESDGWLRVVEDMRRLTHRIMTDFPGIPVFLFGHSMGSFLARYYISRYGHELAGVILSGTAGDPGMLGKIGKFVAGWEAKRKGVRARSPLLNKLSFGNFNKPFKPNRTEFDWLSRDSDQVDKYVDDPYCGAVFTAGFFQDLVWGVEQINTAQTLQDTPRDLPMLILSGDRDPVGKNTRGVQQVYNAYRKAGLNHLTLKLYKDGRHEMLNEINREEVYSDVIQWMDAQMT